ncbi:hypothetical protein, partial [Micrococcus flavus]
VEVLVIRRGQSPLIIEGLGAFEPSPQAPARHTPTLNGEEPHIVSRSTPEEVRTVVRVLDRLSDDAGEQAMHGVLLEIGGIGYAPSESARNLREVLTHASQLAIALDDALDATGH